MKRILLVIVTLLSCHTVYATSWKIDDLYTFTLSVNGSGGMIDADSVPSYRIYEDETGTAILTGSMAKLDDANTTGYYSEQVTLSAANGLEKGKSYNIIMCATVSSTTSCTNEAFQIEAEVDSNTNSGAVTLPTIPTDWITAGGIADGTLGTPSETYLAAGTEGAGTSTSTLIYTSLSDNTRKYNNMCLWASSNGERSKIIGYGSGTFSIRGYNVAPTDGTALRIYTDGCQ